MLAYLVVQFVARVGAVVLALLVGLLFTALMRPAALWLERRSPLGRLAATWVVLLAAVAVALAVLFLVQQRFTAQLSVLRQNLAGGVSQVRDLLVEELGLNPQRVDQIHANLLDQLMGQSATGPSVVAVTAALVAALAGLALALFTAFWLIYQGEKVAAFLVGLVPGRWRPRSASSMSARPRRSAPMPTTYSGGPAAPGAGTGTASFCSTGTPAASSARVSSSAPSGL
jgi:predicted PurR-regulated permease PerM